jgi:hypothetical protein
MVQTILALLFSLSSAQAYTLNNNFGASFKNNRVNVMIDRDTTCSTAGVTPYELQDMIDPAIEDFWNRVPTSSLRLKNGGFTATTVANISTGRLCAPTNTTCINNAGANVIAPVTEIVIACNNEADNFGDPSVLAVTIPNNFSGKSIKGAVILINESSTAFANLSRSDKIGVLAHEIGHAIGLGHSDVKASLMYYRTTDQRKSLGEDDIRGVSYLYPMLVDGFGLLGGCGTIDTKKQPPTSFPYWPMVAMIIISALVVELRRLFKRPKTRATA